MPVHLIKLAVGIESIDHLADRQAGRIAERRALGEPAELLHFTRHPPRRTAELLDGGSIYWVVKGFVRVRQAILRVDVLETPVRGKRCALILDPNHVRTQLQARRPHQGWRYLPASDAPPDLSEIALEGDGPPPEMAAELRALGLI